MHRTLTIEQLLTAALAFVVACSGSDAQHPRNTRDAGQLDAAMSGKDAAAAQPSLDSGIGLDAALRDAAQLDAAPERDAASGDTKRDAGRDSGSAHDAGDNDDNDNDSGTRDAGPPVSEETFAMRVVASGLAAPWEVTWGPDNWLWITLRTGAAVIRMQPATGEQKVALSLSDVYQSAGQDGVLGMALHPQLGKAQGNDYVYLAYTYDADASADVDRRAKIVRLTYDAAQGTLGSQTTLLEGLSASSDHNSGRLVYGPDAKLYYTIGDQGHNQFDNMCLPIRAQDIPTQSAVDSQDWSAYQGKILRIGLDGAIPSDNPVIAGVRSHIFSYGHRNAQGLAFGADGKLYASEQGPKTDDEINLIAAGKNYGWPNVAGFRDDNAYVYGNWSASSPDACDSLTYSDYVIPDSVPKQLESAFSQPNFVPPLKTFYTVDNSFMFANPACPDDFICWPTIAPASLDLYDPGDTGLKTWGRALLLPNLKLGSVMRVPLSANGETTEGEAKELFKTVNRYRDLAIAPDRRTFYIITDSDGATSGPTQGSTQVLTHRGAVLEFKSLANN